MISVLMYITPEVARRSRRALVGNHVLHIKDDELEDFEDDEVQAILECHSTIASWSFSPTIIPDDYDDDEATCQSADMLAMLAAARTKLTPKRLARAQREINAFLSGRRRLDDVETLPEELSKEFRVIGTLIDDRLVVAPCFREVDQKVDGPRGEIARKLTELGAAQANGYTVAINEGTDGYEEPEDSEVENLYPMIDDTHDFLVGQDLFDDEDMPTHAANRMQAFHELSLRSCAVLTSGSDSEPILMSPSKDFVSDYDTESFPALSDSFSIRKEPNEDALKLLAMVADRLDLYPQLHQPWIARGEMYESSAGRVCASIRAGVVRYRSEGNTSLTGVLVEFRYSRKIPGKQQYGLRCAFIPSE
jgi:hypothetical protein